MKSNLLNIFCSGYGSQAVSSTNLSSEDSMSIRSISVDETPDVENRAMMLVEQLQPVSEINDPLGEIESDSINHSNWKQALGDKILKNEVQSDSQKQSTTKLNEMQHNQQKIENVDSDSTESSLTKAQVPSSVPDRNSLSLELTNSHSSNLGYINNSSQKEREMVGDASLVMPAVNEGCDEKHESKETTNNELDYCVSTTESPTSDSQSEASRIAAYDSSFTSPSEDVQMLAGTESTASKAVSSPEPANTPLTNSGDDESPCEGTSVVHTRLPPGKVREMIKIL